jgi:hypothetical protein
MKIIDYLLFYVPPKPEFIRDITIGGEGLQNVGLLL